jgi:hypothetical protein
VTFAPGDDWKKALDGLKKSEVRGLRGAVPLADFDWRDFPVLVDLSGVNWTELPEVPDAVKATLALTSLPAGLRLIPDFAFDGCRSLALAAIPDGVVSIGRFAFRGCTALRLKKLPQGLKSIEEGAFEGVHVADAFGLARGARERRAFGSCVRGRRRKIGADVRDFARGDQGRGRDRGDGDGGSPGRSDR